MWAFFKLKKKKKPASSARSVLYLVRNIIPGTVFSVPLREQESGGEEVGMSRRGSIGRRGGGSGLS